MRIGVVTDFYLPWVGGPAAVIHNVAHGLSTRGHDVSILAPSAVGAPGFERDVAVGVVRAPSVPVPFGYRMRACVPLHVSRWLQSFRPDVIHVHHPFPLSAAAVFAAGSRGIPVVATNHTIPACSLWGLRHVPPIYNVGTRALGAWIVRLLSRCAEVATPTATAATMLRDLGFPRAPRVISNGVDIDRFSPGANPDLRRRFGLDDRPVVLYTGRLDAEKDMETWLRAAAAAGVGAQYVVGGQGADRPRLEVLARGLGLDSLRFIGYVEDDVLPDLYRMADLYFITGPVELQSISTLEALASGLPVIAVDAGALPELVCHDEEGLLIPPGNHEAAAAALRGLLPDTGRRLAMGRAARHVAESHNIARTVSAYDELLSDVAARTGARGERATAGPG